MSTLKCFRKYTLEVAIIVHTSLSYPQRTQAKSLLSHHFPVWFSTGEESCTHMLNCRQKSTTILKVGQQSVVITL
jgi:hypothetical protein